MESHIWHQENISIQNLSLWDENARFPDKYFNKTEKELLAFFCSKKNFKIFELAAAIVKDFDLPQLEKIVVYNYRKRNIVIEGNRRLAAYKLLSNPSLTDDSKLKKKLLEIKRKIDIDDNFELECLVTGRQGQGLRYLDRKHLEKNNEISWGENERTHHKKRRGKASDKELFKVEISKLVRGLDLPEEMKDQIFGPGYVTNFWRIIDSDPSWKLYGFSLGKDKGLNFTNKNLESDLKVIIINVLQKKDFSGEKIDSRTLNTNESKKTYLKSIDKKDYKKVETEIEKYGFLESVSKETKPKKLTIKKSLPTPTGLFYSKDVPYRLRDDSLKLMYNELRDIEVDTFPNATHDLLRSFLECSLIVFFKEKGEFSSIKKRRKLPTLGEMLTHILDGKSKAIKDSDLIKLAQQIKTDYDQPYSLQRLNMANHDENWVSSPLEVRSAWAKLRKLFKFILDS